MQTRSASPCPTHEALEVLQAPLWEVQDHAILAWQNTHVTKQRPWRQRRVTAFEKLYASNNRDNDFCAEEVHLLEGHMHCVSCHRRWKLLQSFGWWVAHVCSPGYPPFLSSLAAGHGRLVNKQLNNIFGGKFSKSSVTLWSTENKTRPNPWQEMFRTLENWA